MDRLTPAELHDAATDLFDLDPPARVMAINEDGLIVPLPTTVRLRGHQAIVGPVSAMDLVVPEDVETVIAAWMQARTTGRAGGRVHPAVAPSLLVDLDFVDARHTHGVYLGFVSGAHSADELATGASDHPLRPRFGISHKDELAIFTHCDDGYLHLLGWPADELIGRRAIELVHPEDHPRAIANWMDLLAHPGASRRTQLRHRRVDGSWVWLEITNTNHLRDPDLRYVLGETVDISDEMAATEALRAGRELLARLTDALPVGVLQLGPSGTVAYRNDRIEAILGRPIPPETALDDLWEPGTAPGPQLQAALAHGEDSDREIVVERPDGGTARVEVAVRALRAADGEITGAVACLNDVSEAVALREELAHRATFDPLTGCLTRRALLERLDTMLAGGRTVTAFFLDLDSFKPVNDRFGHTVGDALLRHVGHHLTEHVGDRGLVGRLGGDEFLVATTEPCDPASAAAEAEAVRNAIGVPLLVDGVRLSARASVGVARSGTDGIVGSDDLIAAADGSMYRVKAQRRSS